MTRGAKCLKPSLLLEKASCVNRRSCDGTARQLSRDTRFQPALRLWLLYQRAVQARSRRRRYAPHTGKGKRSRFTDSRIRWRERVLEGLVTSPAKEQGILEVALPSGAPLSNRPRLNRRIALCDFRT